MGTSMFCVNCGKENIPARHFCIYCGAKLAAPTEPGVRTSTREPAPRPIAVSTPSALSRALGALRSATRKKWPVAVAAACIIVIAGVTLGIVLASQSIHRQNLKKKAEESLVKARKYEKQVSELADEESSLVRKQSEAAEETKKSKNLAARAATTDEKIIYAIKATEAAQKSLDVAKDITSLANKVVDASINAMYATAEYLEAKLELGSVSGPKMDEAVSVIKEAREKINLARRADAYSKKMYAEAEKAAQGSDKKIQYAVLAKEGYRQNKTPKSEKRAAEAMDDARASYTLAENKLADAEEAERVAAEKTGEARKALRIAREKLRGVIKT